MFATQTEIAAKVQFILVHYFNIESEQFSWEKPLEELHPDFKILSYLIFLEQLLQRQFGEKILVLENISPTFHTPTDLIDLIESSL